MKLRHLCCIAVSMATTLLAYAQQSKLDSIYAPTIVGTPPSDAYIGLSMLESGEIRHYNYGEQALPGTFYLSSLDSGLTWKKVSIPSLIPYADTRSPLSGEYIRIAYADNGRVYTIRTAGGLDAGRTITKITDQPLIMCKPPVFIRNGKRVLVGVHTMDRSGCGVLYSDDDGLTWTKSQFVNTPLHAAGGFHKGIRWNHGAVEPTVIELQDGRLWMIIRTPQDTHYQSFSEDGGETWQQPTPSPFYGTLTMPTLGRLKDGRMIFMWNNTTPLPELASANGVWDDVFTNRNVLHAAISEDDGKTWTGMRELVLDEARNDSDFGSTAGADKSVHQTQFVEPTPGKLLVALGQSSYSRKMVLFDVDWLYAKSRSSNFSDSLNSWSTFKYYKGIKGHCGYNRTEGGQLVAHPTAPNAQVLWLRHVPNDSLVDANDGAVWNFPAAHKGEFKTRIAFAQGAEPAKLLLNDRWFNASDSVAAYYSMYTLNLDPKALKIKDTKFHEITIRWDLDNKQTAASVWVDGKASGIKLPLKNSSLHGISYVHFLTDGAKPDPNGLYIESTIATKLNN